MKSPTIADILSGHFDSFVAATGPQPLHHLRVVNAITSCRTPALGGYQQQCDHCGNQLPQYFSCRNRHCPRCQSSARAQWVDDRLKEMLPVGYFHVVFTIPQQLNQFALRNKKHFYDCMFRAVKETLLELAANPKRLGADIGFVCILHTWGQTLVEHPHIHCIVPGGGFDATSNKWKAAHNGFLFPIPVLRKLFRGKLMAFFTQAVKTGNILLHGSLEQYREPRVFSAMVRELYQKEWVVYAKAPFASPQALVSYLGAYTHRVAIANRRILSMENGAVAFSYRDYAEHNKEKVMQVSAIEFIRRFLLHIIPKGFRRIRYFGFMAAPVKAKRFAAVLRFFHRMLPQKKDSEKLTAAETLKKLLGFDPLKCRVCHNGRLQRIALIPRAFMPWPVTS
jgi:hypothetical protein